MAEYTPVAPIHEDHYIERDRDSSSGAGVFAVLAVIIVLLALVLFGGRLFGRGNSGGTNINGTVNVPSGGGPNTQ